MTEYAWTASLRCCRRTFQDRGHGAPADQTLRDLVRMRVDFAYGPHRHAFMIIQAGDVRLSEAAAAQLSPIRELYKAEWMRVLFKVSDAPTNELQVAWFAAHVLIGHAARGRATGMRRRTGTTSRGWRWRRCCLDQARPWRAWAAEPSQRRRPTAATALAPASIQDAGSVNVERMAVVSRGMTSARAIFPSRNRMRSIAGMRSVRPVT